MILEKQLENKIMSQLSSMTELSACQIVGSRDISETGTLNEQDDSKTVIAIGTGYRMHEAFSLPMIDVPVTITIASRIEEDSTAEYHESVVEKIADKISYWHFHGQQMSQQLNTEKFICGELRSTGGSGRTVDQSIKAYTDNITFTIRGSEVFNN